jgi:hypothetical protein
MRCSEYSDHTRMMKLYDIITHRARQRRGQVVIASPISGSVTQTNGDTRTARERKTVLPFSPSRCAHQ